MSLPKITAYVGENVIQNNKNQFASIIKTLKKTKKNEERYITFLVLDLAKDQIYFQLNKKLSNNSVYEYNYFGNNSAAAAQCYLTRETNSIKYLLTHTFGDLYLKLNEFGMSDSQLATLLKRIESRGLLKLGEKIKEGRLNLAKLSIVIEKTVKEIKLDEDKAIYVDEKKYNPEEFIRLFIEDDNKNNKYVLVVPKVILENGNEIILSNHSDYLELVRRIKNLRPIGEETDNNEDEKLVCYLCNKRKKEVTTNCTKDFDRTGINKIFTITTVNYSQGFKDYKNMPNNYYICNECYQKLLFGEKIVSKQFKSKISGEDVFIIPEALKKKFDYNRLNVIKNDVDLAFKSDDAEIWIDTINMETKIEGIDLYTVNFVFYRTDGNSVTVLETIEDVPVLRLEKIMKMIDNYKGDLKPHIRSMSLGSIYGLIAVKTSKNIQVDIGKVLSLYKAILTAEKVSVNTLYSYAVEALEKGLSQLCKSNISKINNYKNLNILKYWERDDFFIKRIIFGYIVLIKTCQELNILDKEVFLKCSERRAMMDSINTPSKEINSKISNIEEFLDNQGFIDNAKALFYLGILINRVAIAQYNKEHKTKPILKKIQFQGMTKKEIYRLYGDVVEKLRQYDKMTLFTEAIMNRFHYYFGTLDKEWDLNDQANVFYIMAGYSYMVGNKSPDMTEEEISALNEMQEEYGEEK